MNTNTDITTRESAVVVIGHMVQVWTPSPTGDSSDYLIDTTMCEDEAEAMWVAQQHRTRLGISA